MGKVYVTGQDAELAADQRIVEGTQAMTIYKPLKNLATRAAELAVKMAKREIIVAREELNNGKVPKTVHVKATKTAVGSENSTVEFDAVVRIDTPGEADYYRNGGIMQYVLRSLLAAGG